MAETLTAVRFEVPTEEYAPEAINHVGVPRVGETVEVAARFSEEGERIDPDVSDHSEWWDADYGVVLRGVVEDVVHHYHSAPGKSEETAKVYVAFDAPSHGYCPDGLD